jgi:hypothetical protein
MIRKDAQLPFAWLCRHYGYPGEVSERPASSPLAQCEDDQQRDRAADHKSNGRMRRNERRDAITMAIIAPSGLIHINAARTSSATDHGGTCWRCPSGAF